MFVCLASLENIAWQMFFAADQLKSVCKAKIFGHVEQEMLGVEVNLNN